MKTIITTLSLLLFVCVFSFGNPGRMVADTATHKLTVTLSGVNKRSGKVYIGLANDASSFSGQSIMQKSVDVPASGEISITFDKLKTGRYAVRVYQDLNDNQKIDMAGMMPTEPFGFSNVSVLMGPPDFDQSAFDLDADKSINITMIEM
ncbi:DUF2141 domain-containing protein [Spirosoma sp. KUDC1026]|uniref:DUF2141 domain-containing protein n=1 Tax=Spirosoma sp. KUDC1026 TaxID=2745947 RepID=UPI00159BA82C|nr:DUF2141 domain-containing protein [Spirosoma sp. KUDC1026]QKZ11801.1 DUF2141 domain-containing protein [Spirosoma sp. KUDC1026]